MLSFGLICSLLDQHFATRTAQERLRESEERFRRLSDATFEGIAIHEDGRILDANQSLAAMFGVELAEVVGTEMLDLLAPESRDLAARNMLADLAEPYEAPEQFKHRDLAGLVADALQEAGLEPGRLELEITEGIILRDTEATLATLQRLKELGVHISMDDFGTGYSSLNYLRRFPFDKIKIDRSFIQDIKSSDGDAAIIRAVIGFARSLGMTVTAEGVETSDQLAYLRGERCDEAQGCHLGRPAPADHVARILGQGQPAQGRRPKPARTRGRARAMITEVG